jgi:hypothetical protein
VPAKLEPAGRIALSDESKTRTDSNEINVQTLIASTIFAQTLASKVFEVYSPTLLLRGVACKIMLGAGRPLADSRDVLPDFSGQIIDVMRIPRFILVHGASFGKCR